MDIFNSPEVLALVPLTVALTEVVKGLGVTDRYAPVASMCLGIALGFFVFPTIPSVILGGIVIGLTASGLYSGTRALVVSR
jgi:hypothetical protein